MFLIVGLGNPGDEYTNTPHNMGFMAVDNFQKENNFPDFKLVKKYHSLISQGVFSGQKIILAKPQTFMNNSGQAVERITNYELCPPASLREALRAGITSKAEAKHCLVVIHDDMAFPLGQVKIVQNRGANHHKGVESIIRALGSKDFVRFRIGIRPNDQLSIINHQPKAENFVLKKLTAAEKTKSQAAIKKSTEILEHLLTNGLEKTMTKYNQTN